MQNLTINVSIEICYSEAAVQVNTWRKTNDTTKYSVGDFRSKSAESIYYHTI